MYLRSGYLNQPPQRQVLSAYQIYYREQLSSKLSQGIGINMAGNAISIDWSKLSVEEQERYQNQFEQLELQYQEQLLSFYGGSQQDIEKLKQFKIIPEKPKRPLLPQLRYFYDNKDEFIQSNPKQHYSHKQIYQKLIDEYGLLDCDIKKKFEKEYEDKISDYKKQLEIWNQQYAETYKNLKKTLHEKFKKSKLEDDFQYHELDFKRAVKKLKQKNNTVKIEEKVEEQKNIQSQKNRVVSIERNNQVESSRLKQNDDKKSEIGNENYNAENGDKLQKGYSRKLKK